MRAESIASCVQCTWYSYVWNWTSKWISVWKSNDGYLRQWTLNMSHTLAPLAPLAPGNATKLYSSLARQSKVRMRKKIEICAYKTDVILHVFAWTTRHIPMNTFLKIYWKIYFNNANRFGRRNSFSSSSSSFWIDAKTSCLLLWRYAFVCVRWSGWERYSLLICSITSVLRNWPLWMNVR